MNCPKCEAVILKGETECSNCGYKITLKIKKQKSETAASTNEVTQTSSGDALAVEKLKTYLEKVLEAEILLNKHIENMNAIERKAGTKPKYCPPDRQECVYPKRNNINKPVYKKWVKKEIVFLLITIWLAYEVSNYEVSNGDELSVPILICFFLVSIIYPCIIISDNNKKLAAYNKLVAEEDLRYSQECKKIKADNEAEYQNKFNSYTAEYEKQLKAHEDYNKIEGELYSVKKELSEKRKALYDKNILHPKYRNLDAVAAIYDYISTGRCEDLEGRDGAYNLYEEKLKQDKEDADREKLVSKIKELETELKNKAEQERINQWLMSNQLSMLKDSLEFESERLRDQYSADISRLLADGQSIF